MATAVLVVVPALRILRLVVVVFRAVLGQREGNAEQHQRDLVGDEVGVSARTHEHAHGRSRLAAVTARISRLMASRALLMAAQ